MGMKQRMLSFSTLIYYGDSLGGMLGPQLLANHSGFDAAVLAIAGGDLPVFTTDTAEMENTKSILEALVGPPDRFDRLTPVLQSMVDASDPAVWAHHVMVERFDDSQLRTCSFPCVIRTPMCHRLRPRPLLGNEPRRICPQLSKLAAA